MTGYTAATGVVTVAGALPSIPAAGDSGNVDFRGRLIPTGQPPNELQSMEAWLWEEYGTDRPWTEIECVYGGLSGSSCVRYQRGRTTWMDLIRARGWAEGSYLMFGRTGAESVPASFKCNILIESLVIEGPGSYQVMPAEDTRVGRGFEAADTFMLRDFTTGHSSRVWRWENCKWNVNRPTMNGDPYVATADLAAAGTWRNGGQLQGTVKPYDALDHVIGIIRGTDPSGKKRLGFARGTWDATVNRIRWQDEPAPEGRSNPFLDAALLRPHFTADSTWGIDGLIGVQILQTPDGKWSLLYTGTEDNPDHYYVRALHGAEDRWSFDPDTQWWAENPMLPGFGGVDKIGPEFGGINLFGNRDAEWCISYNPYARDPGRRFAGYCRFKTLLPLSGSPGNARRPVAGWTSPDLRSFFMLPHGNALTPLPIGELFVPTPYAVSDDVTGMMAEFYGGTIRLWASDDDRHFQEVCWDFMPDAGPQDVFRLGDKRIYTFWTAQGQNFSYLGFNRETNYELQDGHTNGMIETPVLMKPKSGWGPLMVNVDPAAGAVRVEVVDARTEEPVAGFAAADCDALAEGIDKRVTWKTLQLSEVTAEAIRLRFGFMRSSVGEVSPKLYEWRVGEPVQVQRPSVERLTVEGRVNPAGVVDDTPSFGWSYFDFGGVEQAACQVLVSSTEEKLAAGEGDLWDTGVVVSAATEMIYDGEALDDQTTYFWKVRVQNAEGVWSEEW
ncbi:MAG: glycoside hydrolase family 78 protein [Armatimonadota bacterium]